jgi:thioredoxin 1
MDSINDEKLNEAINSGKTTLIWFSAEWCGPCKILKPTIEKISTELAESYDFIKADVGSAEETTKRFNIRNIPTCVLTRDGEEISRFSGVKNEGQIKDFLSEHSSN